MRLDSSNMFHYIQQCAVAIITFSLNVPTKFECHIIDIQFKERAFLQLRVYSCSILSCMAGIPGVELGCQDDVSIQEGQTIICKDKD